MLAMASPVIMGSPLEGGSGRRLGEGVGRRTLDSIRVSSLSSSPWAAVARISKGKIVKDELGNIVSVGAAWV